MAGGLPKSSNVIEAARHRVEVSGRLGDEVDQAAL
jgi:hypothetical protein